MKNSPPILSAILLLIASALSITAKEHTGDFWLLRCEHRVSDALTSAINERKLDPKTMGERITQLIKQRKILELAKFHRKLGNDVVKMHQPDGELKIRDIDETIPMGITIEVEPTFSDKMDACDIRLVASIYEKDKKLRYHEKTSMTGITVFSNDWFIMHHWKNGTESTLLLAHLPSLPNGTTETQLAKQCVYADAELIQTTQSNLDTFKKSTPKTRAKAIDWLRKRSKLLAGTTTICRSGQKSLHQDHLHHLYNKEGWSTAALGFLLEIELVLGQQQRFVDVTISAEWQDPEKFRETPEFKFIFTKTLATNQPTLIEPSSAPAKNPDPIVLILTPRAKHLEKDPVANNKQNQTPLPEGISTRTYPVPPSFYRRLNERHQPDFGQPFKPRQKILTRQPLKDLLQKEGIQFPPNTATAYAASSGTVVLRNTKPAHLAFQKILAEFSKPKP